MSQNQPTPVLEKTVQDWRIAEGEAVPDAEAATYTVKVFEGGYGGYIMEVVGENGIEANLNFEINQGVPCFHVSNDTTGDNVLSLFFTKAGVVARADGGNIDIRAAEPGEPGHSEHVISTMYGAPKYEEPASEEAPVADAS